ncbi:MAG: cadherin domain-containing protein [Nitrosomonas sp.]
MSSLVDFASPAGQVDNVTDSDSGALLGIAITAADTANGSWFYSTDNGTNWNALGSVTNTSARLLAADGNTRIYFQSNADYNGSVPSALTFRAWDRTTGSNSGTADTSTNGGTTAFSTTTDTASLTINPINDAPTFGVGDGQTLTSLGIGSEFGKETIILPDGKILVGGYSDSGGSDDFSLVRYNPDGTLDTSFGGGDGMAFAGIVGRAEAMVLQADGKVVLSGYTTTGGYQVCLVRFNADGTLDTSFGGGDGIASSGVSGNAKDVALQTDGKFLVAADLSNSNFNLMRFNSNGALDTSFGGGSGYVSTDFTGGSDRADGLTIQADGKVVLAGFGFNGTSFDVALVRYNMDGSLDTSFNGTGKVLTDFGANSSDTGNEVRIQADGKIVVAGYSATGGTNDFAIARYNTNGTLDTGFGTGGKVTINVGGSDFGEGLAIQSDGKILVTGTAGINGGDVGLVRLNTDGSLDTTFGDGDGIVTTDYSGASDDRGYSVAIQSDGRIVVSGTTQVGGFGGYNVALNRYSSTGSLDTTLDPINTLDGTPTYTEDGSPVVLDADVQIFDAELSALNNFDGATLTLTRNGGTNPEDAFSTTGTLSLSGGNVIVNGTTIGIYTNSGGTLQFTFNANATNTLVNSAMQQIAYSNSNDSPPASVQINWIFNDGNNGSQGTGGALQATGSVTVNITAANDAPTDLALSANTVDENVANGTSVGTVSATDPDSGDTQSYSLTDTAGGRFAIDSSTGEITVANGTLLNYEAAASHSVTVRVTDSGGLTYDETFTVNLTNVNESPTGADATVTINEDGSHTMTAANFGFSDVDAGDSLSAVRIDTLPGAGSLTLSGVAVTAGQVITVADITAGNWVFTPVAGANGTGYASFTFSVRDSNNTYDAAPNTLTVNVTAANDAPTDLALSANTVAENAANGTSIGTVSGTDPDSGDTQSYSLTDTAGGRFAIDSSTGEITVANGTLLNYEAAASHSVTVRVTDSGGLTYDETFTVNLTNVNESPTGADATVTINEDGSHTMTAANFGFSDVDAGDSLSAVRIDTLPGAGSLTLSGVAVTAGQVITVADITAGNWVFTPVAGANGTGYASFTFSVRDSNNTYDAAPNTLTVNVTAANDAPTDLALSANTVAENAANGTSIGTVSGTDPDSGDTQSYSLTDTAGGRFAIDSSTGEITVANGTLLNYEAAASHSVTVRVTDSGGLTYDETFTVNLTNVNESPTGADATVTINEDGSHTMTAANFGFSDVDAGDSLSAVRIDTLPGAGSLTLSGVAVTAGQVITVADITAGNWVFTPVAGANGTGYASFTFSVRDSNNTYDAAPNTLTVNVTAANDAPTDLALSANTVAENAANGTSIGTVSGTDPDSGDTQSYSLTDTAGGRFAIDSSTGEITVANGTLLNYEAAASHSVTVRVTDSGGLTYDETFTVNLTDGNEAPINIVPGSLIVNRNTPLTLGGIFVSDTNDDLSTVQLVVGHGTLKITLSGTASISAGGNGTSSLTLSGSLADINVALASLIYQSNYNYIGIDTLNVISSDSNSTQDIDAVVINVVYDNNLPVGLNDSYTLLQDSIFSVEAPGLLINDSDADDNELSITPMNGPENGTLVMNSDGSFIYTPNKDFVGVDSFTYVVHDGYGNSSPVTVMLTVNPVVLPLPETPSSPIVPITPPSTAPTPAPATALPSPVVQGTIPSIVPATVLPAIQNLLGPAISHLSGSSTENARLALQPAKLLQDHANSNLPEHLQETSSPISHALLTQNTVIANQQLWEEVENIQIDIQKAFDEKELTANVASVAGISLTAGIVGWLIRSGSMLASLLSIIPAWKSVDPLSIVVAKSGKDTHESLEDDDDTKQKENSAEKLFYPDK